MNVPKTVNRALAAFWSDGSLNGGSSDQDPRCIPFRLLISMEQAYMSAVTVA